MAANPTALGIGDIVMSVWPLDVFQGQHGVAGSAAQWVPCDGARYPHSAWAKVSNDPQGKVPDLVGRYPRGTAVGLPAAGQQIEDAIKDHQHTLAGWGTMQDAQGNGNNQVLRTGYGGNTDTTGVINDPQNVAGETRPKTTLVNFYIRIN